MNSDITPAGVNTGLTRHLARVFANARELGREIDAVEKDFQTITRKKLLQKT